MLAKDGKPDLHGGWIIEVTKGTELIGQCEIPAHRLEKPKLEVFLKALVARYEEFSLKEMVSLYLNRRKGGPPAMEIDGPHQFANPDEGRFGYIVHGPTVSARGSFRISQEVCEFLRDNRKRMRGAHHAD